MRPDLSRMNEGINRGTGIDQREWKGGGVEGEKRSHRVIDGSPTVSGIYTSKAERLRSQSITSIGDETHEKDNWDLRSQWNEMIILLNFPRNA